MRKFTIIDRQSEMLPLILFERVKLRMAEKDREKLRYSEFAGYWLDSSTPTRRTPAHSAMVRPVNKT